MPKYRSFSSYSQKTVYFFARWEKCYLGNDKSDKVKLVLKSSRMINIVIIYAIKMLYKLNILNYSTKMATPISIYGQKSILETVTVRGLKVCLKEVEWPCLYLTCESIYAEIFFVFELFAKNCLFFCALRKMQSRKRQKR